MQQLGEHGVAGVAAGVFGLKPDFVGLDVNQPLGMAFDAQRFDVRVFNVFFGFGFLEGGVQGHSGSVAAS